MGKVMVFENDLGTEWLVRSGKVTVLHEGVEYQAECTHATLHRLAEMPDSSMRFKELRDE